MLVLNGEPVLVGIMLDSCRHFVLGSHYRTGPLKPHYSGVASDVDHSMLPLLFFFCEDATIVLLCGPCRLRVLLNRSCNSGSQLQNRTMLTMAL